MEKESIEVVLPIEGGFKKKWFIVIGILVLGVIGISIYSVYQILDRAKELKEEQTRIERSTELQLLTKEFYTLVSKGSFNESLSVYVSILDQSQNNELFTGESILTSEGLEKAKNLLHKSGNEKDSIKKSQILLELGKMMYEFGNTLYYTKEREKYGLTILYYYSRAITTLDSAIVADPRSSESYRYRGIVLADIGILPQKTISDLRQAIKLNPHDDTAFYKLGNIYDDTEQYNLAIQTYLSGLTQNPKHELMRNNLGITYFNSGNRHRGYTTFYALAKDCKEFCNAVNYNIANNLAQEDSMERKEIDLEEVKVILTHLDIAIEKSRLKGTMYRDAYRRKGEILSWVGRDKEAIKYLTLSLNDHNDYEPYTNSFNQNNSEDYTYYLLGWIYKKSDNKVLAEKYAKEGLLKYPDYQSLKELWEELVGYDSQEDKNASVRVI